MPYKLSETPEALTDRFVQHTRWSARCETGFFTTASLLQSPTYVSTSACHLMESMIPSCGYKRSLQAASLPTSTVGMGGSESSTQARR